MQYIRKTLCGIFNAFRNTLREHVYPAAPPLSPEELDVIRFERDAINSGRTNAMLYRSTPDERANIPGLPKGFWLTLLHRQTGKGQAVMDAALCKASTPHNKPSLPHG